MLGKGHSVATVMRICSWLFLHTSWGKWQGNKNGLTLPRLNVKDKYFASVSEYSLWVPDPEKHRMFVKNLGLWASLRTTDSQSLCIGSWLNCFRDSTGGLSWAYRYLMVTGFLGEMIWLKIN